ncbi:MAG: type II toxin-antitoxin system HicB family antitoxin [Nostoc sp.]|uniref:type II toxin-antitoxin system HicB family antitoxin n=1 Tax=Nostoc sp. TaxID=1180 RepID=UPI002FFAF7FB
MSDRYSIVIQWSDEDNCYLVHLPEFPWQQFHTHGQTRLFTGSGKPHFYFSLLQGGATALGGQCPT